MEKKTNQPHCITGNK